MPFRMPPMPFPMPPLFITSVKDIYAINTFEKLLNISFSEVYCWHFGCTTPLFSVTTTDRSLYEALTLFPRWRLVFRSFLLPPLVARDVVTPDQEGRGDPNISYWSILQKLQMKSTLYFRVFRDRWVIRLLCCCCCCFFFRKNWKKWNRIKYKSTIELQ